MDEKGSKKKSKSERNKEHKHLKMDVEKDLGSSGFVLEAGGEKRKKHKDKRKNKHGLDKGSRLSEVLEEDCTDIAADGQTCPLEGNNAFVNNDKEERSKTKRKKRKGGRDNGELVNNSEADENKMQPSDDNEERKRKKRKTLDNLCAETQEDHASKPEGQTCPIEGDNALVRNYKGERSKIKRKKRNGGRDNDELVNNSVANENKMQPSDDNRESKKKKRKPLDNFCAETKEDHASKQDKKSKRNEDHEFKSKTDARVNSGHTKAHYFVSEIDGEGMKMEKEKKKEKMHGKVDNCASGREVGNAVEDIEDHSNKIKKKKKKKKDSMLDKNASGKEVGDRVANNDKSADLALEGKSKRVVGQGMNMVKKKRKRKIHSEVDNCISGVEVGNGVEDAEDQSSKIKIKKKKKKKKKKKDYPPDKNASGEEVGDAVANTGKSADLALEGKSKRVTFADQVKVLNDGLVRGKRFTPEEDEKVREAVFNYIESHQLGDDGLDMILHCGSHREVRNCWKEIGASLPHRPHESVYYRAHILFERDERRKWTTEEYEFVRKFQGEHGSDWKTMAEALGKHRFHVKDAWRRIKLENANTGRWSQEEYQNLFDLVNVDLRVRAQEECRKSKHGMLRDNICWEAIGDKLATRASARCCKKWYDQLTSPMVAEGIWADTDDYCLIRALYALDACCMEEVDWDYLFEHRAGDVCRK